jgi:hypothetical protein
MVEEILRHKKVSGRRLKQRSRDRRKIEPNAEKTNGQVRGFALLSSGKGKIGQGNSRGVIGLIPTAKRRSEGDERRDSGGSLQASREFPYV